MREIPKSNTSLSQLPPITGGNPVGRADHLWLIHPRCPPPGVRACLFLIKRQLISKGEQEAVLMEKPERTCLFLHNALLNLAEANRAVRLMHMPRPCRALSSACLPRPACPGSRQPYRTISHSHPTVKQALPVPVLGVCKLSALRFLQWLLPLCSHRTGLAPRPQHLSPSA